MSKDPVVDFFASEVSSSELLLLPMLLNLLTVKLYLLPSKLSLSRLSTSGPDTTIGSTTNATLVVIVAVSESSGRMVVAITVAVRAVEVAVLV